MSYCHCGRPIHWPKGSLYGDKWRCYNCGQNWTLVPDGWRGKPTKLVKSRRQAPKPRVVVVQMAPPPQNPFLPPGTSQLPALPAPPRRGGLLAWLFGE
jgi:hypothetical protein